MKGPVVWWRIRLLSSREGRVWWQRSRGGCRIGCGRRSSRCFRGWSGGFAIRGGSGVTIGPVWRGSCMCCGTGCRGGRCLRSRGFRAVRRAGGGWISGSGRGCGRRCWRACRRGWRRRSGLTGRGRSSMPRSSMQKGGRAGRALAARPPRQPLPRSRRRARAAAGGRTLGRQHARSALPAAADRPCLRPGQAAARGLGRPRLRQQRAPRRAHPARYPAADQPPPPRRRPDPRRDADARDLARPQALPQSHRPTRPPPLAGRAHQRLAPQLAPHLNPLGTPTRALPRPPPTRLLNDHPTPPRMVIVRPLPATANAARRAGWCAFRHGGCHQDRARADRWADRSSPDG
jgi:hypothetical protein